jgi:hypothetical protein
MTIYDRINNFCLFLLAAVYVMFASPIEYLFMEVFYVYTNDKKD